MSQPLALDLPMNTTASHVAPEDILGALRTLRLHTVTDEYKLHDAVSAILTREGMRFAHEVKLAPRCRIDFVIGGHEGGLPPQGQLPLGVGLEIKKGQPNKKAVVEQVARYASTGKLAGIILLVERNAQGIPSSWFECGIPAFYMGASKLWGIAL